MHIICIYRQLIFKLIERLQGYKKYDEAKIKDIVQDVASRNLLRAWEEMEKVAENLQKSQDPNWEWIPTEDTAWDKSSDYGCKTGRDWPANTEEDESSAKPLSFIAVLSVFAIKLLNLY